MEVSSYAGFRICNTLQGVKGKIRAWNKDSLARIISLERFSLDSREVGAVDREG